MFTGTCAIVGRHLSSRPTHGVMKTQRPPALHGAGVLLASRDRLDAARGRASRRCAASLPCARFATGPCPCAARAATGPTSARQAYARLASASGCLADAVGSRTCGGAANADGIAFRTVAATVDAKQTDQRQAQPALSQRTINKGRAPTKHSRTPDLRRPSKGSVSSGLCLRKLAKRAPSRTERRTRHSPCAAGVSEQSNNSVLI